MDTHSFHTLCSKYHGNNKDLHVKKKVRNGEFIVLITAYWAMYFCIFIFPTESFPLKTLSISK